MSLAARNEKVLLPVVRRGLKQAQLATGPALVAAGQQQTLQQHEHEQQQQQQRRRRLTGARGFHHTARARNPAGPGGGGGSLGSIPPSYFQRPSLPANTVIRFVPQQTAWIVERMGKAPSRPTT
ncbi:hypothetical protein DL766_009816 [Monosporascus sp. MC13-8B]|uniref:Uncharacterized protein n=1 Tax=Monosporascus cannonballus TaxID=155416 RepID=A0ABY0GT57_9PEZI|nr:hypothetical protein DL763_010118 [Monosporascus cannonballus]RYO76817.1 hypothetical protein DL762_009687 [Monosporascus cannonballus]RYP13724.1 hypothetical protein DL766_009816 [Monosporascus sp. MC13-8B]